MVNHVDPKKVHGLDILPLPAYRQLRSFRAPTRRINALCAGSYTAEVATHQVSVEIPISRESTDTWRLYVTACCVTPHCNVSRPNDNDSVRCMDGGSSTDADAFVAQLTTTGSARRSPRKHGKRPPAKPLNLRKLGGVESFILASSPEKIARWLGVAPQTAREWRRLGRIPKVWHRAARVLAEGNLGDIHPMWKGWRISETGRLQSPDYSPQGPEYAFEPKEITALPHTRMRLAEFEARDHRGSYYVPPPPPPLTRQADWVSNSWTENNYKSEEEREREHFETLLQHVNNERSAVEQKYRKILSKLWDWRPR